MAFYWGWQGQPDNLGVAVFAHRAAALGHDIQLTENGYCGPDVLAGCAAKLTISGVAVDEKQPPTKASTPAIRLPRIALYTGTAIGYPYYAYYAHSLWSLGLSYISMSAADIAGGRLDNIDLLIMPGGFATWGLDRAETLEGVDSEIARFIARRGAYIGSCGGAFYMSEGRPGWHGAIDAKPRFTHEYLLTGTCLLNVQITDAQLRRDLPESLEMPYFHGPIYDNAPRSSPTLAVFGEHVLENRLFIANPLEVARYDAVVKGQPAILSGRSTDYRVIGFSAHPEMGEFLRKSMMLDTYVRKYLPIRGAKTMRDTLRFYAEENCIAFRLILNAAMMLGAFEHDDIHDALFVTAAKGIGQRLSPRSVDDEISGVDERSNGSGSGSGSGVWTDQAWRDALASIRQRLPALEGVAMAALIEEEFRNLETAWSNLLNDDDIQRELAAAGELKWVIRDAMLALSANSTSNTASAPETLVLLALPVRLLSAHQRMVRYEMTIGECV